MSIEGQENHPEYRKAKTPGEVKCGTCGISGVKIYRPYGFCYRLDDNVCNKCLHELPEGEKCEHVPTCPGEDGEIWGFTSVPKEVCDAFFELPEADHNLPSYIRLGESKTMWTNNSDYGEWVERLYQGKFK